MATVAALRRCRALRGCVLTYAAAAGAPARARMLCSSGEGAGGEGTGGDAGDAGTENAEATAEAPAARRKGYVLPATMPKALDKEAWKAQRKALQDQVVWHDLTGEFTTKDGAVMPLDANARLSMAVKQEMAKLNREDPARWTAAALAKKWKVREQRVLAILALKELEAEAEANGEHLDWELEKAAEEWFGPASIGTGERHVRVVPRAPKFEVYPDGLPDELVPKAADAEDADALAKKEEAMLVAEFKEALDFNLGRTGKSISRKNRFAHPPKRPEGGWSIVFTPLGKTDRKAFVSEPGGAHRDPNADEQLLLDRRKPKPRRKIL